MSSEKFSVTPEEIEEPKPEESKPAAKKKVVVVDTSGAIRDRARDVAEAKLTESRDRQKGVGGFFRKIWKHNLFHEYYRQKEIQKAKSEIEESGNLYAGEEGADLTHSAVMGGIVDQFSSEYEEAIHSEVGERRETLGDSPKEKSIKLKIKQLLKDFSSKDLSDENVVASFVEERNRIFTSLENTWSEVIDEGSMYADNLLEIAKQVQQNIEHGQKLEELDLDFDVVVGKAKMGVRTEAQFNSVDKIIEKIQKTRIGRFANETTISSAVAIAYSLSTGLSTRLASSKLFAWGTFGATAALGAGVAGLREKKRLEEERRQHAREMASGRDFSADISPRRKEMEEFRYETKEAEALADALEDSLFKVNKDGLREVRDLTQEELEVAMANLSEVEARISLSDREKVDLISYSDERKVANERLRLDILRAEAKVNIQKLLSKEVKKTTTGGKFEYEVEGVADTKEISSLLKTPEYKDESDPFKRKQILAYWLHGKRMEAGTQIPDIEEAHGSFTPSAGEEYARWDWYRAEEILEAEKAAGTKKKEIVLGSDLKIPGEKSFDEFLSSLTESRVKSLVEGDEGMEKRDALFKAMRNKKVAKAVVKGLLTGVVIGGAVQEIGAFFKDGQEGLFEGLIKGNEDVSSETMHMTSLEYLRRLFTGDTPIMDASTASDVVVGNLHANLPEGAELAQNSDGTFNLLRHGEVLGEPISVDAQGHISTASTAMLAENGVNVFQDVDQITEMETTSLDPQSYAEANKESMTEIQRKLWFDNDTPKPVFDKNELKLWWGGEGGTGIDANNNFVYNVGNMTGDGSFHDNLSTDALELAKAGKLMLLISLSQDTQNQVFKVLVDENFNAVIDPNSEVGKLFFANVDGHAKFLGKFAEVAEMMGPKDGVEQVRILATDVGRGLESIVDEVPVVKDVPVSILDVPLDYQVDPPPFIPVFGRKPLEPTENKRFTDFTQEYFYSQGGGGGLLKREEYRSRMSKEILENKELDLSGNDSEIVDKYLAKQSPEYYSELEELVADAPEMSAETEVVITVPAYQEGKNLEKTIRNYAKLSNRERFEIVILENNPQKVERDQSAEVIERMKREFPDLKIVHLHKEFKEKPAIGEVRKYLVDSVLLRKSKSGKKESVVIASNDADLEEISPEYANRLGDTFKGNKKLDAVAAKWDFTPESFRQFPLLHASQRLWHYFDIAFRNNYLKSPDLVGRNSAFRSGAYAAVGGYNEKAEIAEDLEIGWLIKEARGHDSKRVGYVNTAWLRSNPRRAIVKMLSGGPLVAQYGDFHTNEEVRKAPIEELIKEKRDLDEEALGREVQAIYSFYSRLKKSEGGWVDDEKMIDISFKRAMGFLGIKYRMEGNKVVIEDTSKLVEGLEK